MASAAAPKMRATIPFPVWVAGKTQPCFMNQGGWLKSLAGSFMRHFENRQPPQFVVNHRQQLFTGTGITTGDCGKDFA